MINMYMNKSEKEEGMKVKDWVKKSEQLKDEYDDYIQLRDHCIEIFTRDNFNIGDMVESNVIMIYIMYSKDRHEIHYEEKDGKIKKLRCDGKTINGIVNKISKNIDNTKVMKKVLEDSLYDSYPKHIDDIKKELDKKETKIKQKPGCVELQIGKEKLQLR